MLMVTGLLATDYALDFDGINDYVDLGSPSALVNLGQGSYTIEAWIKTSDSNTRQCIVGNWDWSYSAYVLELYSSGQPRMYVYNTGYNASTDYDVDDGLWHHIVGVRDFGNDIKIYLDGEEIYSYGSDNEGSFTVPGNTMIARNPESDWALHFDGNIDEVRIWNDVRTQTEIQDNMYNELAGNEDNLVAYLE